MARFLTIGDAVIGLDYTDLISRIKLKDGMDNMLITQWWEKRIMYALIDGHGKFFDLIENHKPTDSYETLVRLIIPVLVDMRVLIPVDKLSTLVVNPTMSYWPPSGHYKWNFGFKASS